MNKKFFFAPCILGVLAACTAIGCSCSKKKENEPTQAPPPTPSARIEQTYYLDRQRELFDLFFAALREPFAPFERVHRFPPVPQKKEERREREQNKKRKKGTNAPTHRLYGEED